MLGLTLSTFELVLFIAGCSAVSFNLVLAGCNCRKLGRWLRDGGRSWIKSVSSLMVRKESVHTGSWNYKVRETMDDMLCRECEAWIGPICVVLAAIEMLKVRNRFAFSDEEIDDFNEPVHNTFWAVALWITTFYFWSPSAIKRECRGGVMGSLFSMVAASPGFVEPVHILKLDAFLVIPRFCLSLWTPTPIAIVCNGTFTSPAAVKYVQLYLSPSAPPGKPDVWIWYCAVQFILCVFLAPLRQVKRRSEAQRILELGLKTSELGAARGLLETVCDAVVELDSKYCFTVESARLEATLMLMSGKIQKGDDFLKYIGNADEEQIFKDNVTQAIPLTKGLANTFQVQLRDSAGLWIRTRMYHVPFLVFGQRMQHLIGISEIVQEGDTSVAPTTGFSQLSWPSTSLDWHPRLRENEHGGQPQPEVVGCETIIEFGNGSGSETSSVCTRPDKFKLSVDTTLSTLDIIWCSHSFSNTTGMNAGDKFINVLPESQREVFTNWIKAMVTRTKSGLPTVCLDAVLRPNGLRRFGLRITAVASIGKDDDLNSQGDSGEFDMNSGTFPDGDVVLLTLDNLKCIKQSGHLVASRREVRKKIKSVPKKSPTQSSAHPSQTQAKDFNVGDHVQMRDHDGEWLEGTVTCTDPLTADQARWDEVEHMVQTCALVEGDRVQALPGAAFRTSKGEAYKEYDFGTITKIYTEKIQLIWDRSRRTSEMRKARWQYHIKLVSKAGASSSSGLSEAEKNRSLVGPVRWDNSKETKSTDDKGKRLSIEL